VDYEGIVLLSSPRSGTTLVQRILDSHPDLHGPPETNVLNGAARFLREDPVASGFAVGTVSGLAFAGIPEEELLERVREFAFGLFRTLRDRARKRIWVEKSPYDMFHVPAITRICGDAVRYLWLVRNPLDVVLSTRDLVDRMGIYPFEFHDYVRRFPAPLEAFAHAWVDTNRAAQALAAERPDRLVLLRYEDLLEDAPREVRRLFEFFGLPVDAEGLVRRALESDAPPVGLGDWKTYEKRTLSKESLRRWTTLPTPAVSALVSIVRPLAEELGYDDLPRVARTTAAHARRQYQLGRMVAHMKAKVAVEGQE
jgi:protein-tyrosine sulfotransferase